MLHISIPSSNIQSPCGPCLYPGHLNNLLTRSPSSAFRCTFQTLIYGSTQKCYLDQNAQVFLSFEKSMVSIKFLEHWRGWGVVILANIVVISRDGTKKSCPVFENFAGHRKESSSLGSKARFFLKKEIVKSRNESQVYVTNAIETDHRSYFERVRVDPPPKLIFRANKWKS